MKIKYGLSKLYPILPQTWQIVAKYLFCQSPRKDSPHAHKDNPHARQNNPAARKDKNRRHNDKNRQNLNQNRPHNDKIIAIPLSIKFGMFATPAGERRL